MDQSILGHRWTMQEVVDYARQASFRDEETGRAMHRMLVSALGVTGPLKVRHGPRSYVVDSHHGTLRFRPEAPGARDARLVDAPDLALIP